jgi:hypothetical protein
MRSTLPLVLLAVLPSVTLTAQDAPKTPPWSFAVGPAWDYSLTGINGRAEYSVMRDRWFGLRLETGLFWTPDQSILRPFFWGFGQAAHVNAGLLAVVSPLPRRRFSPYVTMGVAAVQSWSSIWGTTINPIDGTSYFSGPRSHSRGEYTAVAGLGLRLRVGDRPFKVELRRYGSGVTAATLGTSFARPR